MKNNRENGIVLVSVMLTLVLLGALSAFFIGIMISEFKISTSNRSGVIGFYAAESGIQEAFFRVKNSTSLGDALEDGTISYSFTKDPYLMVNTSCTVSIQAIAPGEAQITATGQYHQGMYNSQRIVKAKIVVGVNPQKTWTNALYGSRDVDIFGSHADINGDLYAARDVDVWGFSRADVNGSVYASGNISVWLFSQLNVSGEKRSQNFPPAPSPPITMPIIDFDSANPSSLKNMATQVYTQQQFSNLLKNNNNLTLNGITYVTGNIDIKKTHITVNGALVADGNIDVGMTFPGWSSPDPSLIINQPSPGTVSGLFSKSKVKLGLHADDIITNGLIYCMDEFTFFDFGATVSIRGGIIAGEISLRNIFGDPINIAYDASLINPVINLDNEESQPVRIEHWEESY